MAGATQMQAGEYSSSEGPFSHLKSQAEKKQHWTISSSRPHKSKRQSDFLILSYDGRQGKKTDINFQWLVPTQLFSPTRTEGEDTIFLTLYS